MKNQLRLFSLIGLLFLAGCGSLVERAEKAHWTAFVATDSFLKVERSLDNSGMRNEEMHEAAEDLRNYSQPIFLDTFDTIQEYKENKTPDGKIELEGAIKLLKSINLKASKYLP